MRAKTTERLVGWWCFLVCDRPRSVLLVAAALALLSIEVTVWGIPGVPVPFTSRPFGPLAFQSDRNALISDKLPWSQRFIDWTKHFAGTSDMYVVLDVQSFPDRDPKVRRDHAEQFMNDLGAAVQAAPNVAQQVVWRFKTTGPGGFSPKAIRLAPMHVEGPGDTEPDFISQLARIADSKTLLSSPTPWAMIASIQAEMGAAEARAGMAAKSDAETAAQLRDLGHLFDAFATRLENPNNPTPLGALMEPEALSPWTYQYTENGRLLIMRITPHKQADSINALGPAIAGVRKLLDEARGRIPGAGVQVGMTGIDVLEADETDAATWDSTKASIIAAVLIAALLVLAFQSWRTPMLLMAALSLGVAWAFGFLTLTVGHLQVLSIVFVILLLGLGIAYGIYLASRFEMVRHQYPDDADGFKATMRDTFVTMAPGTALGCVTAAASFATTIFTDFRGVAEMGVAAGGGILLCLIAMFSVFPALLRLFKPGHRHITPMESRYVNFFSERWVMPFVRHPVATLAAAGVLTVVSLLAIWQMRFDMDLIKLQPKGMESVEWQDRIVSDGGECIYTGTSIAKVAGLDGKIDRAQTLKQAGRLTAAFYQHPKTISQVRGLGLLFPQDDVLKRNLLIAARQKLEPELTRAITDPTDDVRQGVPVVEAVRLGFMRAALRAENKPDVPAVIRQSMIYLDEALGRLIASLTGPASANLPSLQNDYTQWRQESAKQIAAALDDSPLTPDDLPPELLHPYIADDGRMSLDIVPNLRLPSGELAISALDPRILPAFIADMRAAQQEVTGTPDVTGVVVQVYESGGLIRRSYEMAGLWALVAVALIVTVTFRSLSDTLMTLVPVVIGFAVTFGIMWLAGMQINAANIIVLPLMFGIGVDSGVQIIFRSRMDQAGSPPGLTSGTGKGVTVTVLTSLIGFGAMMLARHRGIFSLGFVLTVGIGLTMLACWTVMPAMLELRRRRSPSPRGSGLG
jgi:uncharacterized protein